MSWYSGSQLTKTSRGVACTTCAIARMLASRLACVSATPLGLPVLPEVYWMKAMSSPRTATGAGTPPRAASCCGVIDMAQAGHAGLQQAGDDHRLGHRHQQRGAGVVEDAGVAQHMLLELRGARRRVDRHRHRAGAQDAEVGAEVRRRGRQHDGHALARLHAGALQAGRQRCAVSRRVGGS